MNTTRKMEITRQSRKKLFICRLTMSTGKFSNPMGWSTSRITLFHHCNKKYFFQYYTNYLKDVSPDIRLDTLLLKNLTSFKMRLGEKSHHIISDYLRLLLKQDHENNVVDLKNAMRSTMEQEFHMAKQRQYKRYDKDQKFGFKEFCYGDDIIDQLEEGIGRVL